MNMNMNYIMNYVTVVQHEIRDVMFEQGTDAFA